MEIKIKKITPLEGYKLYAEFDDNTNIIYDLKWDFVMLVGFSDIKDIPGLFEKVQIDESRTNIFWREDLYLPVDLIYDYGEVCDKMQ